LTNASTKSQKRMQALQPQLKAITEKYKDDAVKKNEKTMEFYKQNKVSPLGSCLPTLLQLPVFYGFYWMMRGAIELRGAHFLWAFDLSQPDTIATIAGFPINPLPLIMGATQLWHVAHDAALAGHGPWAAKAHALDAADDDRHFLPDVGRIDALLDGAKPVEHCAVETDQDDRQPCSAGRLLLRSR
jgi:hypothetical protein